MATINDLVLNNTFGPRFVLENQLFVNLAALKILQSRTSNTGPLGTPREIGSTSGYQVPVGKKYIVLGVKVVAKGATVASDYMGLQAAGQDVGLNTLTSPTGKDSDDNSRTIGYFTAVSEEVRRSTFMVIPAGRYLLTVTGNAIAYWTIYGFEVDANATTFI